MKKAETKPLPTILMALANARKAERGTRTNHQNVSAEEALDSIVFQSSTPCSPASSDLLVQP